MAKSGKRTTSRTKAKAKAAPKRAPKPAAKPAPKPGAARRSKSPAAASAAPPGPVTLEEARALARAKRPALAARAARKPAAPPASPQAVGLERERLEKERREEFANRIREYKETMSVMKARGARRPRARGAKGARGAKPRKAAPKAADSFLPLQIFAEGDSWFDYPVPFFGGGIVPRLENRLGVPILNLAKAGDEVRFMLGVEERILLTRQLTDGCPAGGPWDVLLFSGGGNDVVDNPMALWVRDFKPGVPAAALIHQKRFDTALALVRAGYEDLLDLRDRLSPRTHLVYHGYDFAIPDGRGICHLGPWLKPTFDLRGFPARAIRQQVVKVMLEQFAAMLKDLASPARNKRVSFIGTQGILAPQPASWHNELHPARAGFETFAALFQKELKALFPDRVA